VAFIQNPPRTGRMDLVSGLWLHLKDDRLALAEGDVAWNEVNLPQLRIGEKMILPSPGEIELQDGWTIKAENVEQVNFGGILESQDERQAWIDADLIELPMKVRGRIAGDRFRPLGMGGHSLKISDFFINIGLAKSIRDQIPLVCSGDEIIWIPGVRLSDRCRISETTSRAIRLVLSGPGCAVSS
jgi:tRNA(Ile)-lysidine synthetase-like protein